jgi:hypothetical protein
MPVLYTSEEDNDVVENMASPLSLSTGDPIPSMDQIIPRLFDALVDIVPCNFFNNNDFKAEKPRSMVEVLNIQI